jgi:hypothetical protein
MKNITNLICKICLFGKIVILQYVPEEKMSLVVTVSEGVGRNCLLGPGEHTEDVWFGNSSKGIQVFNDDICLLFCSLVIFIAYTCTNSERAAAKCKVCPLAIPLSLPPPAPG